MEKKIIITEEDIRDLDWEVPGIDDPTWECGHDGRDCLATGDSDFDSDLWVDVWIDDALESFEAYNNVDLQWNALKYFRDNAFAFYSA